MRSVSYSCVPRGQPKLGVADDSIQIFVINLEEDERRLARFAANMRGVGAPFRRWSALAGRDLETTPLQRRFVASDFGPWGKNEAACALSHVTLLEHIVQAGLAWSIIMEDDGILRQSIPNTIGPWSVPSDADIVLLNDRASAGPIRHSGDLFSYSDVAGGAGTEGYMVSLRGAQKLLRILSPVTNPLDFQMYAHFESVQACDISPHYWRLPRNPRAQRVNLNAYRIVPGLVSHTGDESSIGNQRHRRAHFYCKVLLGLHFDGATSCGVFSGFERSLSCGVFSGATSTAGHIGAEVPRPAGVQPHAPAIAGQKIEPHLLRGPERFDRRVNHWFAGAVE